MDIWVGPDKQIFSIHRDLLALHSGYFANRFRELMDDENILLPRVNLAIFATFHSWIYSGDPLAVHQPVESKAAKMWAFGHDFKAPGFQNAVMDEIREASKVAKEALSVFAVNTRYNNTKKGSLLRRFTADTMNCKDPFQRFEEGSEAWKRWEEVLHNHKDLSFDMAKAEKRWIGVRPWDDTCRGRYMVEEPPLDELWEAQILAKRTKEEITAAANAKCVRSIIELAHLQRRK